MSTATNHLPLAMRRRVLPHRSRLEGTTATVHALSPPERPRPAQEQDHRRRRARALRLRLGARPAGQTALSEAQPRRTERRFAPEIDPHNPIGDAVRSRLENPRWHVIDPTYGSAPQSLERGSSVTNNSLAASQRPNISLIDRRLSDARRVPYRVRFNVKNARREKAGTASPLDRGKPYQRSQ
jgi:hypothetical protein